MDQVTEITAQEVELFLLNNLDFFAGRDRLIKKLHLSHESGSAISLLERQNELLRKQAGNLESRLDDLITNARNNDRMFQHLQRLVLTAITAGDLAELESILKDTLCQYFNVDAFRLFISEVGEGVAQVLLAEEASASFKAIDRLLSGKDGSFCGGLSDQHLAGLFDSELLQGSIAISRNSYQGTVVTICLGSRDPGYYRNSMDTLFLNYLSQVVSRLSAGLLSTDN